MTPTEVGALLTAGGGILAALITGAWAFRTRRVDVDVAEVEQETEERKVEASATDAFLKGQMTFQEYVDGIVEKRVAAAVAPLEDELKKLSDQMKRMRAESHEIYDAVVARETQLWLWNVRDRVGPMPEIPEILRHRLKLDHLTTVPTRPQEGSS